MSRLATERRNGDPASFIRTHSEPLETNRTHRSRRPPRGITFGDLVLSVLDPGVRSMRGDDAPRKIRVDGEVGIAADVTPARESPRGTIVFVHGFGGNRTENGLFRRLAAHVSSAGFNSVSYDWRGIGDSGGTFAETTMDDHLADFVAVTEWSRQHFRGAPVYAVGFSLGAAVVGLALQRDVEFEAVAYLSPAVRPCHSMWPRYRTESILGELERTGVVCKPGSSLLIGHAMLHALRDTDLGPDAFAIDVPLLVCHGTGDTRIDCSHTQELVAARGLDRDFGYLQVDQASHSFRPGDDYWDLLGSALTSWFTGSRRTPRSDARTNPVHASST